MCAAARSSGAHGGSGGTRGGVVARVVAFYVAVRAAAAKGDLLDGGWLTVDDETFDATARRFERIFRWPSRRDALGDAPTEKQKKYYSESK